MNEPGEPPGDPPALPVIANPEQAAGVWASFARATHSAHEVTIDFIRIDPYVARGMLVARVAVSPGLLVQLIDILEAVWHAWSRQQLE